MMKKSIFAFLAVLAVFAMVMTGCPETGPGETTYTVTFDADGGEPEPAAIPNVKHNSTINRPEPDPEKDNFEFDGWWENVDSGKRWNFFTDKVTKTFTLHAKWKADTGTTISSIVINGIDFDTVEGASKGFPGETLAEMDASSEGVFEPGNQQPTAGVTIAITTKNSAATATWAVKSTTPAEADFGTTSPVKFNEGDKLYIKVVNDENTAYYIINVYFSTAVTIFYGQPVINGETLDALWTTNYNGPTLSLSRIATNEVTPKFKFTHTVDGAKAHTLGEAKAYWDDDGLYIYATITYHDYYKDEADEAAKTPTARVTNKVGNYQSDSLEIMINTRYQRFIADNFVALGQQFRVGFYTQGLTSNNQDGNAFPSIYNGEKFVVGSGNHQNLPDEIQGNDIMAAFRQSGQFYAWVTTDASGKETGYKVLAKVPWYLNGREYTDQVFDATTGRVKDNAKIGLEFQINTNTDPTGTGALSDRDGLITWNSVTSQAVTNVSNYGVVTLAKGSNPQVVKAHAPVITAQPKITGNEISVVAAVGPKVPTPSLTYQWYQADNATAAGTTVGTSAATYTPADPTAAVGKYFWVVVTNTDSTAAAGFTTATVTSNRLVFEAVLADLVINSPTIEAKGEATESDGVITLPYGAETTDYAAFTYKFPEDLAADYKKITIILELTALNVNAGKPMKVGIKKGYDSNDDEAGGSPYKDITSNGSQTWTYNISDLTKDGLTPGFTVQLNNYRASPDASNNPTDSYTAKVTKITFSVN
jgi:hypothetical protein